MVPGDQLHQQELPHSRPFCRVWQDDVIPDNGGKITRKDQIWRRMKPKPPPLMDSPLNRKTQKVVCIQLFQIFQHRVQILEVKLLTKLLRERLPNVGILHRLPCQVRELQDRSVVRHHRSKQFQHIQMLPSRILLKNNIIKQKFIFGFRIDQ